MIDLQLSPDHPAGGGVAAEVEGHQAIAEFVLVRDGGRVHGGPLILLVFRLGVGHPPVGIALVVLRQGEAGDPQGHAAEGPGLVPFLVVVYLQGGEEGCRTRALHMPDGQRGVQLARDGDLHRCVVRRHEDGDRIPVEPPVAAPAVLVAENVALDLPGETHARDRDVRGIHILSAVERQLMDGAVGGGRDVEGDGLLVVPGVEVHGADHQPGFRVVGGVGIQSFVPGLRRQRLLHAHIFARSPVVHLGRAGAGHGDVVEDQFPVPALIGRRKAGQGGRRHQAQAEHQRQGQAQQSLFHSPYLLV